MTDFGLRRIEDSFWPDGATRDIWMILDAARDPRVFSILLECHLEYTCLYSSPVHPALETAAPYLVQLDYDYRDTRRLLQSAWGNSWGVFLRSETRMERLRDHLRELLVVRDTRGRRMLFRYYDPRVMRVYLPTCTPSELLTVFGPIECFWMEGKTPEAMLQCAFDKTHLLENTLHLTQVSRAGGA